MKVMPLLLLEKYAAEVRHISKSFEKKSTKTDNFIVTEKSSFRFQLGARAYRPDRADRVDRDTCVACFLFAAD